MGLHCMSVKAVLLVAGGASEERAAHFLHSRAGGAVSRFEQTEVLKECISTAMSAQSGTCIYVSGLPGTGACGRAIQMLAS